MKDKGPFRAGPIEPIAEVGQNLLILNNQAYGLFTIAFIEPIPISGPLTFNAGAIVAGAQTAALTLQNIIDMQYGELGQFRMRVLDDIAVQFRQPQALLRYGTKQVNAEVTLHTAIHSDLNDMDNSMTEFYVFEDQRPFVVVRNPSGYNLAQSRIQFYGFRYVLTGRLGKKADGSVEYGSSGGQKLTAKHYFKSIEDANASGEKFTVVPEAGWGR